MIGHMQQKLEDWDQQLQDIVTKKKKNGKTSRCTNISNVRGCILSLHVMVHVHACILYFDNKYYKIRIEAVFYITPYRQNA